MIYEELNSLSNRELMDLEDTLLLEREMDTQMRVKHTGGRFVLFVLTCLIWAVLMVVMARVTQTAIKSQLHGIISFVGFFVSFGMSVLLSQLIWRKSGVGTRVFIRNAIHYWPVTTHLIGGIIFLLKS